MAQNGNVVPLGEHPKAKARLSARESADVLTGCRELALDRMARALGSMLDRVEDDLFELAEKSDDREAQNTYLDARAKAREKRPSIEAAFRSHFVEFFNRKVRGEAAGGAASSAPAELALMEADELEETIAVREMSRKLEAACEGELFALSQRMGFLLERPDLKDDANPLSPSTVCAALKDACEQIGASLKVKLALLRQLEGYAQAELVSIYHDVNQHLVQRRILPEVRVEVRRTPATPRAERPERAPAKDKEPAVTPNDIFGALTQLLGAAMPGAAAAAGGAPMPGGAGIAAGTAAAGAPPIPASFLSELTRMHREGVAAAQE